MIGQGQPRSLFFLLLLLLVFCVDVVYSYQWMRTNSVLLPRCQRHVNIDHPPCHQIFLSAKNMMEESTFYHPVSQSSPEQIDQTTNTKEKKKLLLLLSGNVITMTTVLSILSAFLISSSAWAVDGDLSSSVSTVYNPLLVGRTASLLHPATNVFLFGVSLYSAYLGYQTRRLRSLSEEIKEVSNRLPVLTSTPSRFPLADVKNAISQEITKLSVQSKNEENPPNYDRQIRILENDLHLLDKAQPLEEKYKQLLAERKSLQGANLKEKHYNVGSLLLGAGVSISFFGALNTYWSTGEIFPDVHLFVGMAITILWACECSFLSFEMFLLFDCYDWCFPVAAALVPYMQRGNGIARSAHIGLNALNLVLFTCQIPTGFDIAQEVWKNTVW